AEQPGRDQPESGGRAVENKYLRKKRMYEEVHPFLCTIRTISVKGVRPLPGGVRPLWERRGPKGRSSMKYQVQENCLTIYLPREVDHHNAEEIRREADAVIDRNHIKYVIFDFEKTDFM